jgi:hypothetical protein
MTHKKAEWQGGGAEGERKAETKAGAKPKRRGNMSLMRNTMGHGHSDTNLGSKSAMGKHQETGDGGASDFDTGPHSPP